MSDDTKTECDVISNLHCVSIIFINKWNIIYYVIRYIWFIGGNLSLCIVWLMDHYNGGEIFLCNSITAFYCMDIRWTWRCVFLKLLDFSIIQEWIVQKQLNINETYFEIPIFVALPEWLAMSGWTENFLLCKRKDR